MHGTRAKSVVLVSGTRTWVVCHRLWAGLYHEVCFRPMNWLTLSIAIVYLRV